MKEATSKVVVMFFVFAIFLFACSVENFAVVTHDTDRVILQTAAEHIGGKESSGVIESDSYDTMPYAYQVSNPDVEERNSVFKIIETGDYSYQNAIYCINAEKDFANDTECDFLNKGDLKEENSTASKNLINSIGKKNYDSLIWLMENMYLPKQQPNEKVEYIKRAFSKELETRTVESIMEVITDDDIEIVQRWAIWYFTNGNNIGYSDNHLKYYNSKYSKMGKIYVKNIFNTQERYISLDELTGNNDRQELSEKLYNYLISSATEGKKVDTGYQTYITSFESKMPFIQPVVLIERIEKENKSILSEIPESIELGVPEIEYSKAGDIVKSKVEELLQANSINLADNNLEIISCYNSTSHSIYGATIHITDKYGKLIEVKDVILKYNNSNQRNSEDQQYVNNISLGDNEDLYFVYYDDEELHNMYNIVEQYLNKVINDNSIKIIVEGGDSASSDIFGKHSMSLRILMFKNDILYNETGRYNSIFVRGIKIPKNITGNDTLGYAENCFKEIFGKDLFNFNFTKEVSKTEFLNEDKETTFYKVDCNKPRIGNRLTGYVVLTKETNSIINNPSFHVSLDTLKTNITANTELEVSVSIKDISNIEDGIIAISGQLEYDTDILEKSDVQAQNGWSLENGFNEENLKFVTDGENPIKEDSEIFKIKFKVKDNITEPTSTLIKIKNIIASDGKSDISAEDSELEINITMPEEPVITSEKYEIDQDNKYISKILPKTTLKAFLANIESNKQIAITDKSGNIVAEDSLVATGMTLNLGEDKIYTLVVTGDIDGNSEIGITDLAKMKLHLIEKNTLEGAYFKASDINYDSEVSITDLAKIKLILIDLLDINENNPTNKNIEILLDDENIKFDEDNDRYYILDTSISSIKGKINGSIEDIEKMKYEVYDNQAILIKQGDIEKSSTWSINNIGLIIGENNIFVKAILKDNSCKKLNFKIMNVSSKYIDNLEIDKEDNDEDGLINYLEDFYKTDKNNADTDSDSITDYIELTLLKTDPLKVDSDDNGISDALEDHDGDGINNITEIEIGTDPIIIDTDGDRLSDYEEITTYKTNPLKEDTDGDGASDGWEIENGYDPLSVNEVFAVSETIADETIEVNVTLDVEGESVETLSISPVNNDIFFNEEIPGYISSAFDFNIKENNFDIATISFKFDSKLLEEENFNPTIYYFNEEDQILEELETVIEGNVAKTDVTHFSTYILLNKTQFDAVWDKDIKPPQYENDNSNDVLDLVFVIDKSGSMNDNDPNGLCRTLSKEFISKLRDQDRASIITFDAYSEVIANLTNNKDMLYNALDRFYNFGGTDGSKGIKSAIDELRNSESQFKYIIFLTDGEDSYCEYSYDDLITDAIQLNIPIYTIGMGSASEEILKNIASKTNGKYYYATAEYAVEEILDLKEVYDKIESETIDYAKDSNDDGISDYHTKALCEGRIRNGTGIPLFGGISYTKIQSNSDFDNDGIINGKEFEITEKDGKTYLKVFSSPVLADTDKDGIKDNVDSNPLKWNVCDRDLLIFSGLAYENNSKFSGKTIDTANNIDFNVYANNFSNVTNFYGGKNDNGTDTGILTEWIVEDYIEEKKTLQDTFCATTFKNGNDIVISFRGTDESMEWLDDSFIVFFSTHTERKNAKNYVKKIASKYANCNIYITGHSLGGYLAQIAAGALIQAQKQPASVVYFNAPGIGHEFSEFKPSDRKLIECLSKYSKDNKLISYSIYGDIVSSYGYHYGEEQRIYNFQFPNFVNAHSLKNFYFYFKHE